MGGGELTLEDRHAVNKRTTHRASNWSVPIRFRPKDTSIQRTQRRDPPSPSVRPIEHAQDQIEGVFIISVAARLLNVHPQTLRKYERLGLVRPSRTVGMLRLYSQEDIQKVRLIKHLEDNLRLNLAGVEVMLKLLSALQDMQLQLTHIEEVESLSEMLLERMQNIFNDFYPSTQIRQEGSNNDE